MRINYHLSMPEGVIIVFEALSNAFFFFKHCITKIRAWAAVLETIPLGIGTLLVYRSIASSCYLESPLLGVINCEGHFASLLRIRRLVQLITELPITRIQYSEGYCVSRSYLSFRIDSPSGKAKFSLATHSIII